MWAKTSDSSCNKIIYRLDQILGKQGSKAKDVYASKISLASRVVKVERSVSEQKKNYGNEIEVKIFYLSSLCTSGSWYRGKIRYFN